MYWLVESRFLEGSVDKNSKAADEISRTAMIDYQCPQWAWEGGMNPGLGTVGHGPDSSCSSKKVQKSTNILLPDYISDTLDV